ncbi:endonuclease NucS domain-containing protein [Microcoleus sp. Pol10D4]|uniref:endonuclease NucS domain-containing protein n=1 Tax=Microcoleus sp. Pol10D4 TaxID=3055387 RepID=UPI002FD18751
MLSSAALRKTGSGWEFANEEALEDFVEVHLQILLGLTVIKRQFTVNEQRCDIIAVDENKRLVVLELKNGEDRYVVQQLTRYYDALLEHKPFADRVDYAQPVRLIAITPKFHRDTFTDRKYHGLFFQFLQFAIVPDGEKLYLHFKDVDAEHIARVEITYRERESTENIPSPPKALLKLLSNCDLSQQQEILKTRQKLLCFDKRMEEVVSAGSIKYGKGNSKNSKFCAELCSDSKGTIILFLWVPLKGLTSNTIGRARIWTNWNDKALIEGYVKSGVGRQISATKKTIIYRGWKMSAILNPDNYKNNEYERQNIYEKIKQSNIDTAWQAYKKIIDSQLATYEEVRCIEEYISETEINRVVHGVNNFYYSKFKELTLPYHSLDSLINLSLDKWLSKI